MTFLDARWRNGYVIAGDETSLSNGTHTAAINRQVRPGVQLCTLVQIDGDTALRYDLWPGDKELAGTIARVQTEFTLPSWVTSMTSTKWLRWQFMLPEPWQADNGSGLTLAILSIHDNPAVGVGRVGTFTGFVENGTFWLRRGATVLGTGGAILTGWSVRPGQWEDLVMQVKHAQDSTGFMKVWRNRRKIVDISGAAMTYNDDQGPYPKPGGLYYPSGYPAMIASRTAYDRGMCISDDAHTFDSFMAACGEPALIELPAVAALSAGVA